MVAVAATALVVASGLSACGSDSGGGQSGTSHAKYPEIAKLVPQETRDKLVFDIPMDTQYPPEHFLKDGKLQGFDPDFAEALGEVLGLKFKTAPASFDSIIPGMQAGRYGIAVNDVFVTPEREKAVTFITYENSGSAILTPASNPHGIAGLDSICGLRSAILKGTLAINDVQEQNKKCVATGKQPASIAIFGNQADATLALLSGQADFVPLNSSAAGYAAKQNPKLTVTSQYSGYLGGIIVPKSDRAFAVALKAAVDKLIQDGTYAKLLDKWGMSNNAIKESEIRPAG